MVPQSPRVWGATSGATTQAMFEQGILLLCFFNFFFKLEPLI